MRSIFEELGGVWKRGKTLSTGTEQFVGELSRCKNKKIETGSLLSQQTAKTLKISVWPIWIISNH